jgi:hypothetical protein
MSRTKILVVTLPTSMALLILFQNCSGSGFDAVTNPVTHNFASHAPETLPTPGNEGDDGPSSNLPPGPPKTPVPNPDENRRTLSVCPNCIYKKPSEAIAHSSDTDIINVQAGNYDDCFTINRDDILIRGVNGRAHLTGKICDEKGEMNIRGARTVVENFEFSGMQNPDTNGAGIRFQGVMLTIRNSYFHDGEEGILTQGNPLNYNDTVLVENSLFERLGGGGGYSHAAYFGDHKQVTIKNSIFRSSKDQGHEFKSRAQNNTIDCSIFASLDGVDSYSVNFPDGGNVQITNSLIEQGSASANGVMVDYGSEMSNTPKWGTNRFLAQNSIFLDDRGSGVFFAVVNAAQFDIKAGTIVGSSAVFSKQVTSLLETTQFADRKEAKYADEPALPTPWSGCGRIGLSN